MNSDILNIVQSIFKPNRIYEFKVDFYKTKTFAGDGFYCYGRVSHIEGNKFKFYGCNYNKLEKKWVQFSTEKYDILEFSGLGLDNKLMFIPPPFTEGPRKGKFDFWILGNIIPVENKKSVSESETKQTSTTEETVNLPIPEEFSELFPDQQHIEIPKNLSEWFEEQEQLVHRNIMTGRKEKCGWDASWKYNLIHNGYDTLEKFRDDVPNSIIKHFKFSMMASVRIHKSQRELREFLGEVPS